MPGTLYSDRHPARLKDRAPYTSDWNGLSGASRSIVLDGPPHYFAYALSRRATEMALRRYWNTGTMMSGGRVSVASDGLKAGVKQLRLLVCADQNVIQCAGYDIS
jgi:hypothetical protein